MRALDLFCGAGGATRGLQQAGFQNHVTGVDIAPQPHYCGDRFIRANALDLPPEYLRRFDFIWASPPCQAHTALKHAHNARKHEDLIGRTRELLIASGRPWALENVPGAPLRNPITLCGTMFGLQTPDDAELRRHRIFETSFPLVAPLCCHKPGVRVIGIYGGHARCRRRPAGTDHVPLSDFTAYDARYAMGVNWLVTNDELSQMIPPAYSRYIAEQWLGQQFAARQDGESLGRGKRPNREVRGSDHVLDK